MVETDLRSKSNQDMNKLWWCREKQRMFGIIAYYWHKYGACSGEACLELNPNCQHRYTKKELGPKIDSDPTDNETETGKKSECGLDIGW